jgi:murein DD-endopeptidase MepM/ murein hydrolase activator NlpD
MRRCGGIAIGLALLTSACIPPSPTYPGKDAQQSGAPMDTVFDERPVWEEKPAVAQASPIASGTYVVQSGDTLSRIGERSGAGTAIIAKANGLSPPYALRVGQQLTIPEGRYHRVAAGESGIAIGRAYAVPWASIVSANGLSEPFLLKVGQRLVIPGDSTSPVQSAEARAAAFKLDIEDILTGGEPAQSGELAAAEPAPVPNAPLSPGIAVAEPDRFGGTFGWPVRGNVVTRFGPVSEGEINQGIEIATSAAAPIRASSDGVVAFVGNNVANFGGMILIRHGSGWITAYGRAARTTVTRGQTVKRGDVIGTTGMGSQPKLHFEIRQKRTPVDPMSKLPPA